MNFKLKENLGLSSFDLKMIALVTMVIDHVAVVFVKNQMLYDMCRIIGRLSFPIFCFIMVEGFLHTKNRFRYLSRLFVFAVISEVPYDLAFHRELFYLGDQNIMWQFCLGMVAIWGCHIVKHEGLESRTYKHVVEALGTSALMIVISVICLSTAYLCNVGYSYGGVLLILMFYLLREKKNIQLLSDCAVNILLYGGMQSAGAVSIIPIALYNGKSGTLKLKWLFYVFYPAHLVLLYMISSI